LFTWANDTLGALPLASRLPQSSVVARVYELPLYENRLPTWKIVVPIFANRRGCRRPPSDHRPWP
jgi:hypothetical protein